MTAHNQVCTATRPASHKVCTQTAKTRAIAVLHRDRFLPKVPGCNPDAASANATSLYCRAVSIQALLRLMDNLHLACQLCN
jgi:hypothetical protein